MNQITEAPLTYDAGQDFDYTSWTPGTTLTMTNVPWNNDYRDIVRFTNQVALDSWIDNAPHVEIRKMRLLKFGEPVRIQMGINAAQKYNYCRASNPGMYGDSQRNYYYFILESRYVNAGVTELTLQLDVIQTFGYDVKFGVSMIERGHIGIANSKAFDHFGRDYLAVPEGLDVGHEYRIVHTEHEKIMDTVAIDVPSAIQAGYDILVCSTVDLSQDPGTMDNPGLKSATGDDVQGMPSGANFYVFKSGVALAAFFTAYSDKPWITQSIVSITMIPNLNRYNDGAYSYGPNLSKVAGVEYYAGPSSTAPYAHRRKFPDWRNSQFIKNILGSRYGILKKFLTYPYMIIEMTTWSGSPLVIKPESWQDADATIRELIALMPPGQRIAMAPSRYNADDETAYRVPDENGVYAAPPDQWTQSDAYTVQYRDDFGDSLSFATWLDSFPSLPIVNNMAAAFLAQNRNGLAWQYSSAGWSNNRALTTANTAAGQASMGMQTSQSLTDIQTGMASAQAAQQVTTMANQALVSAISGVAGGAVGGAMAGPGGMAAGAVGGGVQGVAGIVGSGIQQNQVQQSTQIGNAGARASNAANLGNMGYVRDTNLSLAQYAAQGDYANTVAGINAKKQDALLTQPSMAGQFGGDAFNVINGFFGYSLRWKMPSLNVLRMIGDFWLRYGYAINQYGTLPDNWMVMSKFTYWKLTESYILQAPIPEMFKQIIRGIFEKGVTVWAAPEYIGATSLDDNAPKTGVSY